jgi:hypothetical protein
MDMDIPFFPVFSFLDYYYKMMTKNSAIYETLPFIPCSRCQNIHGKITAVWPVAAHLLRPPLLDLIRK